MELSLRERIRAGDPEAFAELFGAHARAVYGHAARLSADRSTAEDVVSLTFLEAWRLREKLRPEAAPPDEDTGTPEDEDTGTPGGDGLRPWLYGIATNVLRNTRRAARRHSAALARLPGRPADHDTLPDFADGLVGRLEDAERLAAARTALGRLRRAEREVFALCVWSGLSYAAAGEALGVPTSTVRSRLARARQRLRALSEAELARRNRPPRQETPGRGRRTGQVPGGRPETARSTQERHG
ncbi:RNA polymerase sigma factor [Streptomyces sp. NPDC051016]|uniref:RNA polymerase sigma factor n=1 Tax=Streptomyces sp. NPDC051016 TaxID=3365638 RepID=UPI0037B98C72